MDDPSRSRRRRRSPTGTPRRAVLQGAAGLALAWMTPVKAAAQDPRSSRPVTGDLLVRVGDTTATPLTPAEIAAGAAPTMAWPMAADASVVRSGSRLNRLVLVRLDPAALGERTRAQAADGVVAYSAVCTHTGCEVGAFLVDEQTLYCDCHQSKFDPRDQGRVTDGPAPRSLPALPLRLVEGRLVVAGPFTARPGFEQG
jgi:rieske iron-sulfur protein